MAYIVNKTNNDIVATVPDGGIDSTSTTITILGKGFNNYGELVAENFVHIMEHFASTTPPSSALRGQLWFDTTSNSIKMNISDTLGSPQWVESGKAIVSGTPPGIGSFSEGSFWYEPTNEVLSIADTLTTFIRLKTIKVGSSLPLPTSGEAGDVFFDDVNTELRVLNPNFKETGGTEWELLGVKVSASAPTSDLDQGDLWYDKTNKQLKVYTDTDSNNVLIVGPLFPESSNSKIEEANNMTNPMIGFIVGNDAVAILSSTTTPALQSPYDGLGEITRGLTIDGGVTLSNAAGQVSWTTGTGTPESVLTAGPGSMYTDIAGGVGATLYVKETGTGNTGWAAK